MASSDYCVLCGGDGAWAFEPLARDLAAVLWVEVSPEPRRFNYLLFTDAVPLPKGCESFVPLDAIGLAADKRRLAHVFTHDRVPVPETRLFDSWGEVQQFRETRAETEWCLKFPTASGASGHRMLTDAPPPRWWPVPFVVQEFVRLERPEVYRIYAAGGCDVRLDGAPIPDRCGHLAVGGTRTRSALRTRGRSARSRDRGGTGRT